jgi:ElaB/YqjD/DUF883 family membrane-anchored ribosome-binding protein
MRDFNDTRERITNDMRAVIAETEALLEALATESKEQIAGVRPRVETAIAHAKARVEDRNVAPNHLAPAVTG